MNGSALTLVTSAPATMIASNRAGLYGAYFFGMTGIGFCLPYLPVYLKEVKGYSNHGIALLWVLSAAAGLLQFPIGLWSDRVGARKPFLVAALALLAAATMLLPIAQPGGAGWVLLAFLVVFFAENGACRATVESLAGAEAVSLSTPDRVGAALGALRMWRPIGIVLTALAGGFLAEDPSIGVGGLLGPLAVLQCLAVVFALFIREKGKRDPEASARAELPSPSGSGAGGEGLRMLAGKSPSSLTPPSEGEGNCAEPARKNGDRGLRLRDPVLWAFVAAMVLFHFANAPPGAYLGIFLKEDLGASTRQLAFAFVISMVVWMTVVRPSGRLSDRIGRRPLLLAGWAAMAVRLGLLAIAEEGWQVLLIQVLDGLGQALFAVAAAAWVTDRLADGRRAGEAQVLVGSSLVLGSALGPAAAALVVEELGFRGLFAALAGVGAIATLIVIVFVPETHPRAGRAAA